MNLYTTYTKAEIETAAQEKLSIIKDYEQNLRQHFEHIRRRILIDDNTLVSIVAALNAGFHVILYGPPGTAKSTLSSFLPVELYGAKCNVHTADSEWNVRKVIGGITVSYDRSSGETKEVVGPRDGFIVDDIMECYESKLATTEFDTVFSVIDEFNRTNMDECLGPMFTAMGSDQKLLKLEYNKGFNDGFLEVMVPASYRIICNMNKYDRTFTNELSEALARRFKWIYIGAPREEMYADEEALVAGNVFGSVADIQPVRPTQLEKIRPCSESEFFNAYIRRPIFDIINDLRKDLELGTSYKIDSIRIASHFLDLKLTLVDWDSYAGTDKAAVYASDRISEAAAPITDADKHMELEQILEQIVTDTIDAALAMTVVPACESLEGVDAIERNQERFHKYGKCLSELERMKTAF